MRRAVEAAIETMIMRTCRECHFFTSEPRDLERAVPGVNVLSSAYGSVRADTAICEHRGIFITPAPACPDFLYKTPPGNQAAPSGTLSK
jgi:hypothetical protein